MATNPYVNKAMKSDGTTIIDISDSTVTADKLAQGYTAYNAAGEQCMILNGEDVSRDIRLPEISVCASDVSAHQEVRSFQIGRAHV